MHQRRGGFYWLPWIITAITVDAWVYKLFYGEQRILRKVEIIYEYAIKEIEIEKARWRNMQDDLKTYLGEKFRDKIVKWGKAHTIRLENAGITPEGLVRIFTGQDLIEKFPISHRKELNVMYDVGAMDIIVLAIPELETDPIIGLGILKYLLKHKIEYEIINAGQREAKHVIIKISPRGPGSLAGKIYSAKDPFSENEISRFEIRDEILLIRLDRLSPGCRVKGSLRCPFIKEDEPFIFVSYEGGKGRRRKHLLPWFD